MIKSLVQFDDDGDRGVAGLNGEGAFRLKGVSRIGELAERAMLTGQSIAEQATKRAGNAVDLSTVTLLCPIEHDDPAHLLVSGTGLTHLGSAEGRDKMHKAAASGQATDSMRMFLMGEKGGRPAPG
ncbi:MAG: hypothetical protein RL367_2471, partial [Pseudomonadota bacterium]